MKKLGIVLFSLIPIALACAGASDDSNDAGDAGYVIKNLTVVETDLHYVEVEGKVELVDAWGGTYADVRFYSDEYETLIVEESEMIGSDLEDPGDVQEFSIGHYQVWVLPAYDGYSTVCAEFRADDSSFGDWTEVGCISGS